MMERSTASCGTPPGDPSCLAGLSARLTCRSFPWWYWRNSPCRALSALGGHQLRLLLALLRGRTAARQEQGHDHGADQRDARTAQGGDVHGVQEGVVGRGGQGVAPGAELRGDAEGGLDGLARGVGRRPAGRRVSLSSMPVR